MSKSALNQQKANKKTNKHNVKLNVYMLYSWYSIYITFNVHNMLYMFCCFGKLVYVAIYSYSQCVCYLRVHLWPQSIGAVTVGRLSNVRGCNIIFVLQRGHDTHACTPCTNVFYLWVCVRVCVRACMFVSTVLYCCVFLPECETSFPLLFRQSGL